MNGSVWRLPVALVGAAALVLAGCSAPLAQPTTAPAVAGGPSLVEEYVLKSAPELEPLTFVPVDGTQESVLARHRAQRERAADTRVPTQAMLGADRLEARVVEKPGSGKGYTLAVELTRNGQVVYTAPAGMVTPEAGLRGVWAYGGHWALEVVRATEKATAKNPAGYVTSGEIILDGVSLNQQHGYDETFGFQLMDGKPFYFFRKGDLYGALLNGASAAFGYSQLPHNACCSAAAMNPRAGDNIVSFFATRSSVWRYVEIGIFEAPTAGTTPALPTAAPARPTPSVTPAGAAGRIVFPAGSTSASLPGELPVNGLAAYTLAGRAGQAITVDVFSKQAKMLLQIHGADGNPLKTFGAGSSTWSGTLMATQEYTITVATDGGVAAAYTLLVTMP